MRCLVDVCQQCYRIRHIVWVARIEQVEGVLAVLAVLFDLSVEVAVEIEEPQLTVRVTAAVGLYESDSERNWRHLPARPSVAVRHSTRARLNSASLGSLIRGAPGWAGCRPPKPSNRRANPDRHIPVRAKCSRKSARPARTALGRKAASCPWRLPPRARQKAPSCRRKSADWSSGVASPASAGPGGL